MDLREMADESFVMFSRGSAPCVGTVVAMVPNGCGNRAGAAFAIADECDARNLLLLNKSGLCKFRDIAITLLITIASSFD